MINFLKAELYRLRKDRFFLLVFAFIFVGYATTTLMAYFGNHCTRYSVMSSDWQVQYFSILKLSVFLLCYIWSQEFRHDTLKNVFCSGNGVEKFYSAKVMVQYIACVILFIWALLCYILFWFFLPSEDAELTVIILERLKGFGILLLYSFAEISCLNMIYTIIKKEIFIFFAYFLVIDKFGSFFGHTKYAVPIKSVSIGNGYDTAISLYTDIKESAIAVIVMLAYAAVINVTMKYLIKQRKIALT